MIFENRKSFAAAAAISVPVFEKGKKFTKYNSQIHKKSIVFLFYMQCCPRSRAAAKHFERNRPEGAAIGCRLLRNKQENFLSPVFDLNQAKMGKLLRRKSFASGCILWYNNQTATKWKPDVGPPNNVESFDRLFGMAAILYIDNGGI